jgi:hypothetical protein
VGALIGLVRGRPEASPDTRARVRAPAPSQTDRSGHRPAPATSTQSSQESHELAETFFTSIETTRSASRTIQGASPGRDLPHASGPADPPDNSKQSGGRRDDPRS